ncbi:14346_t:CDS:1 [Acaulospora morrowiae]|uniref:14346_t:CDS:1 n=1 Tax=Acaulospora morrowiae TaxID=94023 RepID=A0A9N9G3R6_9GLOM|nr:14346_t:CDS:1 [Acaulospora morrowiae]
MTFFSSSIKFAGPFDLPLSNVDPNNRFHLSSIEQGDIPRIYSILGPENPLSTDIHEWTRSIPNPYTISDAEFFVSKCHLSYSKNLTCTTWAIRNTRKEFIGCIGLNSLDEEPYNYTTNGPLESGFPPKKNSYEIGYYISHFYRNLGISSSAVKLVCEEIAFKGMGLHEVYGFIFTGNDKSARVLVKAGFKLEATFKDGVEKNGEKKDLVCYVNRPNF